MSEDLWQKEIAKLGGEGLVQLIAEIRDGQTTIVERLDKMDERHKKSEEDLAEIRNAFPAGDIEGHRRYHETMIESLAERRRLRIAIQEKTISGLIWLAIVGAGSALWKAAVNAVMSAVGK